MERVRETEDERNRGLEKQRMRKTEREKNNRARDKETETDWQTERKGGIETNRLFLMRLFRTDERERN